MSMRHACGRATECWPGALVSVALMLHAILVDAQRMGHRMMTGHPLFLGLCCHYCYHCGL